MKPPPSLQFENIPRFKINAKDKGWRARDEVPRLTRQIQLIIAAILATVEATTFVPTLHGGDIAATEAAKSETYSGSRFGRDVSGGIVTATNISARAEVSTGEDVLIGVRRQEAAHGQPVDPARGVARRL